MNNDNFRVGDKVVYPGHGVGEIKSLSAKKIGGVDSKVFDIVIMDTGMKLMIPVSQAESGGLRKVVDKKAIDKVYKILKKRDIKIDTQTWNRRFREYSQKLKTGSLYDVAEVLRDLWVLRMDKELSYGEKDMLEKARARLVSEIAIAKARTHEKVMVELTEIFS